MFLAIFLAVLCMARGQTLKFGQFTTKDGLPSDEVYNLHQDKKGYVWIFTHYGPVKYNGRAFIPVLKNLPFKESVIYAVYENRQGRKWIANSNKNIYEIVNDSAFIVQGTQGISEKLRKSSHDIYQILVNDKLDIYIKTTLRSYKLAKQQNYAPVDLNALMEKDSCSEYVFRQGAGLISAIEVRSDMASYRLKKKKIRFIGDEQSLTGPMISFSGIYHAKYFKRFGDTVYFTDFNKLLKVAPDHSLKEIEIGEQILNFTKDSNGHLWIACYRNGLIELDENDSIVNHYFKGKTIHDVLADSHNGLWVSTDGRGVYHCRNINELYFDEEEPLGKPVNFIRKFDNRVVVGTTSSNAVYLENGKTVTVPKADKRYSDDPIAMSYINPFYLVSYRLHYELVLNGLNGSAQQSPEEATIHNPFAVIAYSPDTLLYLGRNRIGILKNPSHLPGSKLITLKQIRVDRKVLCAAAYQGNLLLGTNQGVCSFRHDSTYCPAYLRALEKDVVTYIQADKSGNCWFCTEGNGLVKLDSRKKLTRYTTSAGLPGNIVNDIYFVKDSSFLLSTNKGLYYYEGPSKIPAGDFIKLVEGEVQSALISGNKIYVGTKSGLILINTKSLKIRPDVFFNLNAVMLNDKPVNEHAIRSLSYKENNLKFKFDVISYAGETYPLKYSLRSNLSDTGVVGSDELDFQRLSPGEYTLTVSPGITGDAKEIVLMFTIVPAFWQTGWFLVLMIITGLCFMLLIILTVFRYYRQRELKKSKAEKMIAEYRLIALKAQINPHFMSNSIAAIQHLMISNKVDEANEYLAKFSFLVRQVLNFSSRSFVLLKEEIEIIHLYIGLERLRFETINFQLDIDPSIDPDTTFVPPLLLQPIAENAIWHGLLPLGNSKTAMLKISVKADGSMLKLIVEDNGVGRKAKGADIGNSKESKGMAITMQRIENLKYFDDQNRASLAYEDLVDPAGRPVGTRVTIIIPANLHP